MTYLLGQLVVLTLEKKIGLVTGFTGFLLPKVSILDDKGNPHETLYTANEVEPLRIKNPESPTGISIYYGKLLKKVKADPNIKLKLDEDKLIEFLKENQELYKEKQ